MEKQEQVIKSVELKSKYPAGYYVCDHYLQVIKKLTTENQMNKDGSIARTHGTWTNKNNFFIFRANEKVKLSEEDVRCKTIQDLIERGVLRRTL